MPSCLRAGWQGDTAEERQGEEVTHLCLSGLPSEGTVLKGSLLRDWLKFSLQSDRLGSQALSNDDASRTGGRALQV